jgi:hypothetical protein
MTAYGGFSLFARLFDRLGLEEAIKEMVPFSETSPNGCGVYAKVLKFGLTTIAGGFRFTHSAFLGDSHEIYEQSFGVEKIPKSITAVTRFFNRFQSWQWNEQFADELWKYTFTKVIPTSKITEDYLNFDSSVITRYGHQDGAKKGYNPKKKGRLSHHPIFAFLNRSKYVVNLWNRSGDCSSGNGIVEFTKQTLDRLSGLIKIKGYMADSGFYRADFIDFADENKTEYIVSAPMIRVLQTEIYKLENWKKVDEGISVGEFNFQHGNDKWIKKRRYIVIKQKIKSATKTPSGKRLSLFPEEDAKVFNYRYGIYITSSTDTPENIWRLYRLRAGDENIIKENKQDFGLEGYCLKNFYATEASMLFRILFYNIFNFFRSEFLAGKEATQTLHTLRSKYFIIPAVLGSNGKSPILRLGIKKQNVRAKFIYILRQIHVYFNKCNALATSPPINHRKMEPAF